MVVIRAFREKDFGEALAIVNDAAGAYRGVIPADRWHEPSRLLRHVADLADKPVLIGTWADASWAIEFYLRNGFTLVSNRHKDSLLRRYWSIPERQIETSVVLADGRWLEAQQRASLGRS